MKNYKGEMIRKQEKKPFQMLDNTEDIIIVLDDDDEEDEAISNNDPSKETVTQDQKDGSKLPEVLITLPFQRCQMPLTSCAIPLTSSVTVMALF